MTALVRTGTSVEVSRAQKEIDRDEMIGDIAASRPIDMLAEITCFDSASAGEVGLPAEA